MQHSAKYSDVFIPIFADLLKDCEVVLDPMAGTGKLAMIKEFGFRGKVVCNDIESEWKNGEDYLVDEWHCSDASRMEWAEDNTFDAICTSPTYGNRMADNFVSKDGTRRITYRHYLGHELKEGNTGYMQFGDKYREKHREIYAECLRVLKPGGLMIVNVSNHIRAGVEIPVVDFHKETLESLGAKFEREIQVKTPRMGFGANSKARVEHESILIFRK